ncbi:unnamed protein product [Rhodiola kirilowii]
MAYAMLNVPGSAILMRGINPKGLGFVGSELHGKHCWGCLGETVEQREGRARE